MAVAAESRGGYTPADERNHSVNRYRTVIVSILAVVILLGVAAITLPRFLHLETYRTTIVETISKRLGRDVRYSRGSVIIGWGVHFTFHDPVVESREGGEPLLSARKLSVTIPLLPLLGGELSIRRLSLDHPRIRIVRHRDGTTSVDDLLAGGGDSPILRQFHLVGGSVTVVDQTLSPQGVVTTLSDVGLDLSDLRRGERGPMHLSFRQGDDGAGGSVEMTGKLQLPPAGEGLRRASFEGKVTAEKLDPWFPWPYLAPHLPFQRPSGWWGMSLQCAGTVDAFTAKGELQLKDGRLDYPAVFHGVLTPRSLTLSFDLRRTPKEVDVSRVDVVIDGVRVTGNCRIGGIDGSDPRITAHAVSSAIDLSRFGVYIPYGIIDRDVAEWIERHVKGGKLTLVSGTLDGTLSQLRSLGVGTNYRAIAIDARIEDGVVSYGPAAPLFTRIAGRLSLEGKDFILRGMRGFFGSSPLTLDGRITEYVPTPIPCSFPFSMTITPTPAEVAWLLGKERTSSLSFGGVSTLSLTGNGPVTNYSLSGNWRLDDATLSIPDRLVKPGGVKGEISFAARFYGGRMIVRSVTTRLGSLILSGKGEYPLASSGEKGKFVGETNRVSLAEITPYLPLLNRYHPTGFFSASLSLGIGSGGRLLDLGGKGTLYGVSLSLDAGGRLSNISGFLNLDRTTLSSDGLTGQWGTTRFTARGSYSFAETPSFRLFVSSARLSPEDLGFLKPQKELVLSSLRGEILGTGNRYTLRSLSLHINGSPITVSGTIDAGRTISSSLVVTSPMLRFDDVISLAALRLPEGSGKGGSRPLKLAADITADNGTMGDLRYSGLEATVELVDGILYLNPFSIDLYGGRITGSARIDTGGTSPRYQIEYEAEGIDVAKLLPSLGFDRQKITGRLSGRGNLTCGGETLDACERSALGRVEFHLGRGSIDRFPVLSKVFSILNVSQLFKFRLPDMVKNGMPFREIRGTIGVTDGVARTDDFIIRSEAMNISAVGRYDIPQSRIDATIGVQPLQTVDSLVSRIPVVGWILTGKDRRLITAYFEAKGNAEDPKVTAIPVKSLAKGTVEIFRRIFSLPAHLITDTGEVLFNQ